MRATTGIVIVWHKMGLLWTNTKDLTFKWQKLKQNPPSQSIEMSQNEKTTSFGLIIKWSEDMPLHIYNMLIRERKII